MLELLAPGGSVEGLKAAVTAGADAVYMGGRFFGARAYADNPDEKELIEAIEYCHLHNRKLYLTVNTLLKEDEYKKMLRQFLLPLYEHGLDAVLVQDTGVLAFIRDEFPTLPIHASTQMSVQSTAGAAFLKRCGVSRIVPARELSLAEIAVISRETKMEIECFVHGAYCYSYSGQCLLSSLIGGRSGNRGRCAQPCRQGYELTDSQGKCLNRQDLRYLMSMKDLCALPVLLQLIEAGVCSFKIEGRMKRPEYAALTVSVYRRALDRILASEKKLQETQLCLPEEMQDLLDLYNRGGFTTGYYTCASGPSMMAMDRPNHAGTPAARAVSSGKRKDKEFAKCRALEDLHRDDLLEIVSADRSRSGKAMEIRMSADVTSGDIFTLPLHLSDGQVIRRMQSPYLLERIRTLLMEKKLQEKIKGKFILTAGNPAILTVNCRDRSCSITGPVPENASGSGMTEEMIRKQLGRTGSSPFVFETLDIKADPGLFLPVSALNGIRRDALIALENAVISASYRHLPDKTEKEEPDAQKDQKQLTVQKNSTEQTEQKKSADTWSAFVRTPAQAGALLAFEPLSELFLDSMMWLDMSERKDELAELTRRIHAAGKKSCLAFPPLWRRNVQDTFYRMFDHTLLSSFDGFMLRCFDQIGEFDAGGRCASCRGKAILLTDSNLYTANSGAHAFWRESGISRMTLSVELNAREAREIACPDTELIVYGKLPVMFTAQCLKKNTTGCTHCPDTLYLKDRMKESFPVMTHCGICMNEIFNSHTLSLLQDMDTVKSAGISRYRLNFTFETEREVKEIANAAFFPDTSSHAADNRCLFTRGHWKRGVE